MEVDNKQKKKDESSAVAENHGEPEQPEIKHRRKEIGGPKGPEPTRYGDWEKKGRCIDF